MNLRHILLLAVAGMVLVSVLAGAQPAAPTPTTPAGGGDGGADAGDDARGENAGARRGPPGGVDPRGRADAMAASWQNLSAEKRQMAAQKAENARLFALLTLDGDNATGRFVSFGLDVVEGSVQDYAARSGDNETRFFDFVDVPALGEPRVAGAVLQALGDEALLFAYNNPTAQLRVVAANASVVVGFDLADGVEASDAGNGSLRLVSGTAHGHVLLVGEGNLTVDNGVIFVELAPHASVLFLNHPQVATVAAAALHEEIEAIREGRLGAKLSVVEADGEAAEVASEFGVSIRAKAVEQGRAVVTVASDVDEPRAVVINAPADLLNATSPEDVEVAIDGEPATRAASAAEILAGTASANAAFAVEIVEGALQVTVNVPSFSEHDITLTSADGTTGDGTTGDGTTGDGTTGDGTTGDGTTGDGGADTPGLPLAIALLALAAVARLRRR